MSVMRPEGTPMSSDSLLALSRRVVISRFKRRPGWTTGAISNLFHSTFIVLFADKFDNCFPTLDGGPNMRQGVQQLRDESSIVDIADPHPEDRRAIFPCCTQ